MLSPTQCLWTREGGVSTEEKKFSRLKEIKHCSKNIVVLFCELKHIDYGTRTQKLQDSI
jgi:hypothetical protein